MMARKPRVTLIGAAVLGAVLLLAGVGGQATRAAAPNPPFTTGLQLWYEADTTSYADGQAVTTWADKAGAARDLTSSGTSDAPIMRRNAVNGRAAIEFDGVQSLMKTYGSTFTFAQPDTFFVVYRSLDADTSSRAFVFDSTDATNRQVFGKSNTSTSRLYANIDLDLGGIAYPFSDFQIWSGNINGTSSALFQNGVQVGSGNAGGASLTGFTVGGAELDRPVRLRLQPHPGRRDPLLPQRPDPGPAQLGDQLAEREVRRDPAGDPAGQHRASCGDRAGAGRRRQSRRQRVAGTGRRRSPSPTSGSSATPPARPASTSRARRTAPTRSRRPTSARRSP